MDEDIQDALRHLSKAMESLHDTWETALRESGAKKAIEVHSLYLEVSKVHTALEELQR